MLYGLPNLASLTVCFVLGRDTFCHLSISTALFQHPSAVSFTPFSPLLPVIPQIPVTPQGLLNWSRCKTKPHESTGQAVETHCRNFKTDTHKRNKYLLLDVEILNVFSLYNNNHSHDEDEVRSILSLHDHWDNNTRASQLLLKCWIIGRCRALPSGSNSNYTELAPLPLFFWKGWIAITFGSQKM